MSNPRRSFRGRGPQRGGPDQRGGPSHRGRGDARGFGRSQDERRGGGSHSRARPGDHSRGTGRGRGHGPNEPTEVFLEGKRAVPDARLGDLDTLVSSFKQAQLDPRMPLRPGFGTLGKEVSLRSNFLALKLPKGMPIYEYTVTIQRKDDSDKGKSKGKGKGKGKARAGPEGDDGNRERKLDSATKARIFELLESSPQCAPYADYMVHDESGHLVSSQQLPAPLSISVHYAGEGDNEAHGEYVVEIKPRSTFNTDDIVPYLTGRDRGYPVGPFISALNLVFRRQALKNNAVSVGQNKYFFPTVEATPLAIGLEARRGYFMSVRPTFKTLMVNVNVSFAAFYSISGNLAEEMRRLEADNRGRRVSYEFLVGLRVETTHLGYRKTRPITAVEFKTARQASFYCKELGGQVTVENYFRQKYGKLKYPDLPVLNVSRYKNKPQYLPAEICYVPPNQTFKDELSADAARKMIGVACRTPAENAKSITEEGLQLLRLTATSGGMLDSFNLAVDEDMAVTTGRVLPPPTIEYKPGGNNCVAVAEGSWNMRGGLKFQRGAQVASWAVVLVTVEYKRPVFAGTGDERLQSFLDEFVNICTSSGINFPHDNLTTMETPAIPDKDRLKATNILRDTLTRNLDLSRSKPSFVLVLLPEASRAIYSALKALCDRELGVQTLCMLLDQATSLRKQNLPEGKKRALQKQYFANVVLKLNAKLGGENHSLDGASLRWFKEKRTMLVGIDVTHPSSTSAQGAPSIAAVVANTDDKLTQFPASLSLQVNRKIKKDAEEMVQDLRDMLIERLKLYKKTCHALPERVIVYRDGVSEGQYSLVLDKEVPQILEAFDSKELQFESKPTLSVIVCGKRHHARFLGTNKDEVTSNGNTRPGTVVDKGVTDIYNFDFYLQSHSGLKGTVRPTHYIVIYDENRISADEVQSAVHNNSHMYARATKAVSLVPPAYYADIACERARLYLGPLMDGTHPQSSKKTGKKSGEEERLRIFEEAKALWNAHGIHPDLQDTMFYI